MAHTSLRAMIRYLGADDWLFSEMSVAYEAKVGQYSNGVRPNVGDMPTTASPGLTTG